MIAWLDVRYTGSSRDSRLDRRRKLWAWRDGALDLAPRDGDGRALAVEEIDWTGCDRPPGRPAEAGSRSGPPLLVRLSQEERAAIALMADVAGRPISTWVRDAALDGAKVARAVWARDRGRCRYCGGEADHLDHVVPLAWGGRTTEENLVCACPRCGMRKANRTLDEAGMSLREPGM